MCVKFFPRDLNLALAPPPIRTNTCEKTIMLRVSDGDYKFFVSYVRCIKNDWLNMYEREI